MTVSFLNLGEDNIMNIVQQIDIINIMTIIYVSKRFYNMRKDLLKFINIPTEYKHYDSDTCYVNTIITPTEKKNETNLFIFI